MYHFMPDPVPSCTQVLYYGASAVLTVLLALID